MQGRTRGAAALLGLFAVFAAAPRGLVAQERGAIALGEAIQGLGVSARVLMIGAHPDDEDTNLITWLQRGRYVETAYLSLTRGDGGQNLIGNELGEALGVIRTEELLAARRIDGARQYFTRAFDFGFSKDTVDTYEHWPRDSILGDVVRVVRSFRPHVIVAVFSGTTRDGHGHHQVSGLLARAAYDVAADTMRFPVATHGRPWAPPKFYRAARGNAQTGTLVMDVGEYSPLLGRSFGEIAGESRSQHRSQGFGALQRKGPIMNHVRREASRVNESAPAASEKSMFDGVDTSWARFRAGGPSIDSLERAIARARPSFDAFAPEGLVSPLAEVMRRFQEVSRVAPCAGMPAAACADLEVSLHVLTWRLQRAYQLARGMDFEVSASRDVAPVGRDVKLGITAYNGGDDAATIIWSAVTPAGQPSRRRPMTVPAGGVGRDSIDAFVAIDQPWWLARPRVGSMFDKGGFEEAENAFFSLGAQWDLASPTGLHWDVVRPAQRVTVDQVKGELRRPAAGVPLITLTLDQATTYVPAGEALARDVTVRVRAADDSARSIRVTVAVPNGLTVDSATRTVRVDKYDTPVPVTFKVRGRLPAGRFELGAMAEYDGTTYSTGYQLMDYEHIRPRRIYRPASTTLLAVDIRVPAGLKVAYVPGVGDNVAPTLGQLGIPTTVIPAADVARADLTAFTTVVIGPRAYDANPELLAANPKLFDFARKGGVLLVQYGQYEMTRPGATPFPITINRPHDRVTHEDAPVTFEAPAARELTTPNRITAADFAGWVQERGLYIPRTFAPEYSALLSMSDSGEAPVRGGILVAPLGQGRYIYTSLAFFRQLPAGVPGAARLFVNLLSANLAPTVSP